MLVFTSDMSVISWGASTPQMHTMEWTAARCLTSATTPEVGPSLQGWGFNLQSSTPFASVLFPSDSDSLGSKQASEKESVDFKPPEYLLPGCKDLPLTPLQPIRDDRKVREHVVLKDISENKARNKTVTLGRFRNGGGDTVPTHQYGWAKKPQKKSPQAETKAKEVHRNCKQQTPQPFFQVLLKCQHTEESPFDALSRLSFTAPRQIGSLCKWSSTAVAVPAGSDSEQLEPPSRKQEDARGPNVPQRPDSGGQGAQHYVLHTWLLPQPVSDLPFVKPWHARLKVSQISQSFILSIHLHVSTDWHWLVTQCLDWLKMR